MRKTWTLFYLLLCLGIAHAQKSAEHVSVHLRYWLDLPEGYYADPEQRWPLVIFLHGSGERGTDLNKVRTHGPPKLSLERPFPFILVSPQCPEGERWNAYVLNKMLDDLIREYRVDPDRVYVTGLSMGGQGTWQWALANPERFAAIVPVCGRSVPQAELWRLRHLPIWVFHGAKDNVVPLNESVIMVEGLKREGADPKFTIYPEANHDSWTETYHNPDVYTWLLQQRRNLQPKAAVLIQNLAPYLGKFAMEDGTVVDFFEEDGALWAYINQEEMALNPEHSPGVFYAGLATDNRLTFALRGKRKVRTLVWQTRERTLRGKRL